MGVPEIRATTLGVPISGVCTSGSISGSLLQGNYHETIYL